MNTRNDASKTLGDLPREPHDPLRLRNVSGDRIGQILAEVETNVADTGLDPVACLRRAGGMACLTMVLNLGGDRVVDPWE